MERLSVFGAPSTNGDKTARRLVRNVRRDCENYEKQFYTAERTRSRHVIEQANLSRDALMSELVQLESVREFSESARPAVEETLEKGRNLLVNTHPLDPDEAVEGGLGDDGDYAFNPITGSPLLGNGAGRLDFSAEDDDADDFDVLATFMPSAHTTPDPGAASRPSVAARLSASVSRLFSSATTRSSAAARLSAPVSTASNSASPRLNAAAPPSAAVSVTLSPPVPRLSAAAEPPAARVTADDNVVAGPSRLLGPGEVIPAASRRPLLSIAASSPSTSSAALVDSGTHRNFASEGAVGVHTPGAPMGEFTTAGMPVIGGVSSEYVRPVPSVLAPGTAVTYHSILTPTFSIPLPPSPPPVSVSPHVPFPPPILRYPVTTPTTSSHVQTPPPASHTTTFPVSCSLPRDSLGVAGVTSAFRSVAPFSSSAALPRVACVSPTSSSGSSSSRHELEVEEQEERRRHRQEVSDWRRRKEELELEARRIDVEAKRMESEARRALEAALECGERISESQTLERVRREESGEVVYATDSVHPWAVGDVIESAHVSQSAPGLPPTSVPFASRASCARTTPIEMRLNHLTSQSGPNAVFPPISVASDMAAASAPRLVGSSAFAAPPPPFVPVQHFSAPPRPHFPPPQPPPPPPPPPPSSIPNTFPHCLYAERGADPGWAPKQACDPRF